MKKTFRTFVATLAIVCLTTVCGSTANATISFAGVHYDMEPNFPGGNNGDATPRVVVPWRSEGLAKPLDIDGNNVYGTDGYALFATKFVWPHVDCCGSSEPVDSTTWPNIIDLPDYVSDSRFLVRNKVGGWPYALIDDPVLVNGYRDYNWGDAQTPPVSPPHSQSPYVMIGLISENDIMGNNPKTDPNGAGRWAFTLGADVPQTIRVSVMSDGYNGEQWTATEVLLAKIDSVGTILDIVGSGELTRNRKVDMTTFDIVGGQTGDNYAIFAKGPPTGEGTGGIAGVAFDSVIPEPTGLTLLLAGIAAFASLPKRKAAR